MVSLRRKSVSIMIAAAFVTAGCSSGGAEETSASTKIKGRGPITFATGKDTTGVVSTIVKSWNQSHPDQQVRMIELPTSADQQRRQMIQNAQTKSDAFSVLNLDNVWVPEFAAHRWIIPLPADKFDMSKFLDPTVQTAKYRGQLYSIPAASDGGLLFYRKDLLNKVGAEPPQTWEQMRQVCAKVLKLPEAKGMSCYTGQFAKYEGLTVNFAEAVNSAGGEILSENGKPHVNTPAAKKGLRTLVKGFESGMIPRTAIAYKEPETVRAFSAGKLVFARNWPYMWAEANGDSSKVASKFGISPLPGISDDSGVSSLGGHNLAISTYANNKATALDFVKFYTSKKQQRKRLVEASLAPTRKVLYDDPKLQQQYPYLQELKKSIKNAEPRPRVVNYGEVTRAIQDEAYAALRGKKSVSAALSDLQRRLEKLIK